MSGQFGVFLNIALLSDFLSVILFIFFINHIFYRHKVGKDNNSTILMRYRPKHIAEYSILRVIAIFVSILPYRLALSFGWLIAKLALVIMRKRMCGIEDRVRAVFGDTHSDKEIKKILWLALRNFCFSAIELLRVPLTSKDSIKNTFADGNASDLDPYCKDGKGAVIALSHMGNWELAGIALANFGVPLFVIMRSQKNPLIDAYLNKTRESTAIDAVKMGSKTIVGVVDKLKHGQILAILPDIRARKNPVIVDFLGGTANIARGMAFFAKSADVPILPVHIWREGWTKHHWSLSSDAVYPNKELGRDEDVERMTKLVMAHFDELIRKYPDQYFWFNKKWILN